jgi:hypothetical protein
MTVRLKARYSTADLMAMLGISRGQAYRLKKKCGCGRWLYLSKLRDHDPDLYYSLAMIKAGESEDTE